MTPGQSRRRMGRPPTDELALGARRAQILAVATHHFGQRGYAAVSLNAIAREVGVTKAALYHHFPSKDVLYTAMLVQLLALINTAIQAVVAAPLPMHAKLHRLAQMMIMEVPQDADRDALLRDVAAHLSPEQQSAVAAGFGAIQAAFEDVMLAGLRSGELRAADPRLLAHAFQHLVAGFAGTSGAAAGYAGQHAVVDAVVDLFMGGAAAQT